MNRKTEGKTLLIICEGENTEPYYFNAIRDVIINEAIQEITISIIPEPKLDDEEPEKTARHKTPRRKRQLANNDAVDIITGQPPLKYVQRGQEELASGAYDEVWAVFDHDHHPARREAFELAERLIDGKRVNIAFSSIAFEYWVLLHFEKNSTVFSTSACRDGKRSRNCGTHTHPEDCRGQRCINGYLASNQYVTFSTKIKRSLFPVLRHRLSFAKENAAWLRHMVGETEPIWERSPYTDVDLLVSRLLCMNEQYLWCGFGETTLLAGLEIIADLVDGEVRLTLKNIGDRTKILTKESVMIRLDGRNESIGERTPLAVDTLHEILLRLPLRGQLVVKEMDKYLFFR